MNAKQGPWSVTLHAATNSETWTREDLSTAIADANRWLWYATEYGVPLLVVIRQTRTGVLVHRAHTDNYEPLDRILPGVVG